MKRKLSIGKRTATCLMAAALALTSLPWTTFVSYGAEDMEARDRAVSSSSLIPQGGTRPGINIALMAEPSTSFCSGWESLSAVNDGKDASRSTGKSEAGSAYGTWGNASTFETVTYTWDTPAKITGTGLYLWTDNGGIQFPSSYYYEYLNEDGEFVEFSNVEGLEIQANGYNVTTFDEVTTTAIRVTMNKDLSKLEEGDSTSGLGVGLLEWEVYGALNVANQATAAASINRPEDLGGVAALNDGIEPTASTGTGDGKIWHSWTNEGQQAWVEYQFAGEATLESSQVYYFSDQGGIVAPAKTVIQSWDASEQAWVDIHTEENNQLDQYNVAVFEEPVKTTKIRLLMTPQGFGTTQNHAVGIKEWKVFGIAPEAGNVSYELSNEYFDLTIGKYGHIDELLIADDLYPTNYVMNPENAPNQEGKEHQWMGELMFQTKLEGEESWTKSMTSASKVGSSARTIERTGANTVQVTYENSEEENGIKDFKLVETYQLVDNRIEWSITVENTNEKALTFGDFGLPLPFNEYWTNRSQPYEECVVDHSFVGQDSSYIYATRPSGQGKFLLMTPDVSTGAGFEYQDHWRTNNGHSGSAWAQDQAGWANGLNVFYIHSDVIKSTGSSYLENTSLTLEAGESKTYTFHFTAAEDEADMKTQLYNAGIIDAVAVPGMAFSVNMPAKFYLHTTYAKEEIQNIEILCAHDTKLYEDLQRSVSNKQECTKEEGTSATYVETVTRDGEQYHVYDLELSCLGANHMEITYGDGKKTTLQFYAMDSAEDALELHADFVTDKTQVDAPGEIWDKIFDDWMMDTKTVRGVYTGYFGWGDDWGFTHGEYLAEKNVYQPDAKQIKAVDEYLDTFIWNSLMKEHQDDGLVNDWLDYEPNNTGQGTSRGYAYPHVYNTYFSMYKIAEKYPDMADYIEDKDTYLLRASQILQALYSSGVWYNWDTGLMGESTTPDIIAALKKEGYYSDAEAIETIMERKYRNFRNAKYPYGSEYSYDNTGEEAVYTLAKLNGNTEMMEKIDWKTRACRGVQPVWYHYANPTTICGENWWNFQYTASLAGYCMDDWLRLQDNGMTAEEMADAARVNYAAKLANLTCINSGQIDADPENIGTVAWTYQAELGNTGGQGTGGGNIHNGWRQMSGEADTGLFGAMKILSSDVATDNIFGLFGYGCNVTEENGTYLVTPLDGLYTRLNLINEKLSIELDRDQYSYAKVSKDSDFVELTMKNLEGSEHTSDIEFTGLQPGSYRILVNGDVTGSFQYTEGTVTISAPLPAADSAVITIQLGEALENTAPKVDAGEDMTVALSDDFRLEGKAEDDGYPDMTLISAWEVISQPEGAAVEIANADKLISDISLDKTGDYVLKLTVSDGALEASDELKITVTEDPELPETLAQYDFAQVNLEKRIVPDVSGAGNDAVAVAYPDLVEGKDGIAISMTDSYCGHVRLKNTITKRVSDLTVVTDVKLNATQQTGTRIWQFADDEGRALYLAFGSGNELVVGVTSADGEVKETATGLQIGSGYWKNLALTLKDNVATVYIDGVKGCEVEDCAVILADFSDVQKNYIGRSEDKQGAFLNGLVDSFTLKSRAMTAEEIKEAYGSEEEAKPISAETGSVVTKAGTAPVLPDTLRVLYDNGMYQYAAVTWEAISQEKYAQAGSFNAKGRVEGLDTQISMKVYVVQGDTANLAMEATPTAIIDTPQDLGGVTTMNDGKEPTASNDTSNGVWHNWLGNQGGTAWVMYTWDEPKILTGSDAYYFRDGSGNFMPAVVKYDYLDADGTWQQFTNVEGLGVEVNRYNTTTFTPVLAKAIRMTMNPKTLGCGVIEWKVYGYTPEGKEWPDEPEDFVELDQWIAFMEGLAQEEYTAKSWAALLEAIEAAKAVQAQEQPTRDQIDQAVAGLVAAFGGLEYGVQKQHLQIAVDAAEAILAAEADYEAESLEALKSALAKAKSLLEDQDAEQEAVNEAAAALIDAIVQVAKDADLLSLESLIWAVENLDGAKYTADSYSVLQTAVKEAREVLENSDRGEDALADAYRNLSDAIRSLEMKGNKAALEAVVQKAQEILANASQYTESSISGLKEALDAALEVWNNEDAPQKEVNDVTEALTKEIVKARRKGDVDADGRVDTGDSAALMKYSAELSNLDEGQKECADVNGDGTVDTKDAVLILQYAAEKITAF